MTLDMLRQEIGTFLGFSIAETPVDFVTHTSEAADGYRRLRISYPSPEGDLIPAYLLLPDGQGPFAAVLVHHQHAGQRHLGKSEVCGLAGDPLQAFGPALARQGIVVLAPDSICFEDRRRKRTGTEPDEDDVMQHYDELCYRLVRGDTLMRKVLSDSAQAIALLLGLPQVDGGRVGILGHSYGASTVLFHGALDERIRFACASGAAGAYRNLMAHQIGIEMSRVIPGFTLRYDMAHLVACFSPRPLLLVSATQDPYACAAEIVAEAQEIRAEWGTEPGGAPDIEHLRYAGEHELTQERFDAIVDWVVQRVAGAEAGTLTPLHMSHILYMLIGPKGSGKTHIGTLVQQHTDIVFIRVEPIWLALSPGEDGWRKVEDAIDEAFRTHDHVMIESLGAGEEFQRFYRALAAKYPIKLIRVYADPDTCLERVRTRSSVDHIPVSDDRVAEYNRIAATVTYDWALEIDNNQAAADDAILAAIRQLHPPP